MARKHERYIRETTVRPWNKKGKCQQYEGAIFPVRVYYDTREEIPKENAFVVFFENHDRVFGTTEDEALENASKHASILVETREEILIRIQWETEENKDWRYSTTEHLVDITFKWDVVKKLTREVPGKNGETARTEVQFWRRDEDGEFSNRCSTGSHHKWQLEKNHYDYRENETEFPYSTEVEAFCQEMENRLKFLAGKITEMVGPEHIEESKLKEVGQAFLKMLPAPEDIK